MRTQGAMSVLEASYRLDLNERDWLEGIARAVKTVVGDTPPILASIFSIDNNQMKMVHSLMYPEHPEMFQAIADLQAKAPPEALMALYRSGGCESLSALNKRTGIPTSIQKALFAESLHAFGVHDTIAVQGIDSTSRTVSFVVPMAEMADVHPRVKSIWQRISVHMSAGLRLRSELRDHAAMMAEAEAIFDTSHSCLHAVGHAQESSAQDALRAAATAVDRARLGSTDVDEALDLWQGLFAGRWTMVDTFDSDGKRLFVAMKNDPSVVDDRSLTRREQQVVTLVVLGRSDSIISYTLGLSNSTVQTHLHRAMDKMNVASRIELIELATSAGSPNS